MQTLLQNVQDCCLELGLPSPNAALTSTNDLILQIVGLMNRVGQNLTTEAQWQVLAKEYRFETSGYQVTGDVTEGSTQITNVSDVSNISANFMAYGNGLIQDTFVTSIDGSTVNINVPATGTYTGAAITFGQAKFPMPADFNYQINRTHYNKSNQWEVIGPKTPQEWQFLKASYIATGPRIRYRIMNNEFVIWPPAYSPSVVLGFEYQSNSWVVSSDGVYKNKFTKDDDVALFPDSLLILGAIYKFKQFKRFDFSQEKADFDRELSLQLARQAGAQTLSYAPQTSDVLISSLNLPDTGYGTTTL